VVSYRSGKSPNKFFYFITVRDNEGNPRKYVYNVFRSIIKKYNAKYYGVLAKKPFPHVHAVIITEEFIDYRDVWRLIPDGVHFDASILNDKTVDDLKRILRYIDSHDGFLYIPKMLIVRRLLMNLSRILTNHAHPTLYLMVKTLRGWMI